jgi:hypothetical protein
VTELAKLGIMAKEWPREFPLGVVMMNPILARQILTRTPDYRREVSRPDLVAAYADHMRTGRWLYTGQPVQLNEHGYQVDGNHRLHAVVRAGWVGPMAVALGLSGDAAWAMNEPGEPRAIPYRSPASTISGSAFHSA